MTHAIFGKKIGMTQKWGADDEVLRCTAVQVGPCTIAALKNSEGKDGYDAVQLAYELVDERKLSKPELGVFKKLGIQPHRHLREFRVAADALGNFEVGQVITTENLKVGNFVDVTGTSKGRGFTGVMKRHGYHGAATQTHGTHEAFRHAGTGGQGSATPARVPVGMKRPGQHGNSTVTTQNVQIIEVIEEENIVLLRGPVPGPNGGIVFLKESLKSSDAAVAERMAKAAKSAGKGGGFVNPLKAAKRAARGG